MDGEIGTDLAALVALVRFQDRMQRPHPEVVVDKELALSRLHTDLGKLYGRGILGELMSSEIMRKVSAIRILALGQDDPRLLHRLLDTSDE